jgi:hypothetical protein
MEYRSFSCVALVLGELTTLHEVPSQCSVRVCPVLPLEPVPTAQQSDPETHVTAWRTLFVTGRELALVTIAHAVPSHRSMSVW